MNASQEKQKFIIYIERHMYMALHPYFDDEAKAIDCLKFALYNKECYGDVIAHMQYAYDCIHYEEEKNILNILNIYIKFFKHYKRFCVQFIINNCLYCGFKTSFLYVLLDIIDESVIYKLERYSCFILFMLMRALIWLAPKSDRYIRATVKSLLRVKNAGEYIRFYKENKEFIPEIYKDKLDKKYERLYPEYLLQNL